MYLTNDSLPSADLLMDIVTYIARKHVDKLSLLFNNHEEHGFNLLKLITKSYCKIRIHNLAKKYTVKIQGDLVRKKLNKLILFSHQ